MVEVILVRHGRPDEGNGDCQQDLSLNDEGREQALAIAAFLAEEEITAIIASPQSHAFNTARPLAGRLQIPVEFIDGWSEAEFGVSKRKSPEAVPAKGNSAWEALREDPVEFFSVEDKQATDRLLKTLMMTVRRSDGKKIAMFTNGLPIKAIVSRILRIDIRDSIVVEYGSITRLRLSDNGKGTLISLNETGHVRG